jgi:hypothetical protein
MPLFIGIVTNLNIFVTNLNSHFSPSFYLCIVKNNIDGVVIRAKIFYA